MPRTTVALNVASNTLFAYQLLRVCVVVATPNANANADVDDACSATDAYA